MDIARASLRSAAAGLAVTLVALAPECSASELGASASASGLVVHPADETLRDYCHWEGDQLFFELPGGERWELVTSTSDSAIANPGDGSFHPFDAAEVQSALAGVRFPVRLVGAEVFALPYPRRAGLESAAGPGLILLTPGVRPVSAEQQHAEFTHELGHVVQYALMPDADVTTWTRYRSMRGIADTKTYAADAVHGDRPHEIFAEDFRVLCGDPQANYSGTIENAAIAYPTQVGGLAQFVSALGTGPLASAPLAASTAVAGVFRFSRNGGATSPLDVYDVSGRRVVTVLPDAAGAAWTWNGRDAGGRIVRSTVLFARARDGKGGTVRVPLLQ